MSELQFKSIPAVLKENASRYQDRTAISYKKRDTYLSLTYGQFYERVSDGVERGPEIAHQWQPVAFAAGNFIERVFQLGGKIVIDVTGEMLGQELVHNPADIGGMKTFVFQLDIITVKQGGDDRRVG